MPLLVHFLARVSSMPSLCNVQIRRLNSIVPQINRFRRDDYTGLYPISPAVPMHHRIPEHHCDEEAEQGARPSGGLHLQRRLSHRIGKTRPNLFNSYLMVGAKRRPVIK